MKKHIALLLAALLLSFTGSAIAQTLDVATAKYQGLIGEQPDGLLGIVTKVPSQELTALVAKTNTERMAIYKDMADKQRIDINQIKSIAAEKIYSLEKSGNYVMTTGQWNKKK